MIGIIGAMDLEIELLKESLEKKEEIKYGSFKFYKGYINNKEVVVLKSGMGKVSAAVGATLMIDNFKPKYIINTGIAGGLKGLKKRDCFIADKLTYSDVDATFFGYRFGQVPAMPESYPVDSTLKDKVTKALKKIGYDYKTGDIFTADTFVTDIKQVKNELKENSACEMEGAAIAQACYLNYTKFVSIRFISDDVNDPNQEEDYKTFEDQMAKRSAHLAKVVVEEIED